MLFADLLSLHLVTFECFSCSSLWATLPPTVSVIRFCDPNDNRSTVSVTGVYLPCSDQGMDCYRDHLQEIIRKNYHWFYSSWTGYHPWWFQCTPWLSGWCPWHSQSQPTRYSTLGYHGQAQLMCSLSMWVGNCTRQWKLNDNSWLYYCF